MKYFNTLEAWKIDKVAGNRGRIPTSSPSAMNLDPISTSNAELTVEKDDVDLPF